MMWMIVAAVVLVLFVYWRFFFFFRNPNRAICRNDDHVLSPADGTIIYVRHVQNKPDEPIFCIKGCNIIKLTELMHIDDPALLNKSGYLIGVFMSPFDVHFNRAPVAGFIRKIAHDFPDVRAFAKRNMCMYNALSNLMFDERPFVKDCEYVTTNERASFVITNDKTSVYVTQIAERWVKRIVNYKNEQNVEQGQVFGLIRMGSQVDVFVPDDAGFVPVVRERQRVKAGLSVLMRRVAKLP
jgi:phosphatidylserine decarboxylase